MSVVREVTAVALTSDSLNNKQTGTAVNFPTMGGDLLTSRAILDT